MGLVMVTCFNSTMTTLLTARILDEDVTLYGTKVCKRFFFVLGILISFSDIIRNTFTPGVSRRSSCLTIAR